MGPVLERERAVGEADGEQIVQRAPPVEAHAVAQLLKPSIQMASKTPFLPSKWLYRAMGATPARAATPRTVN